MTSKGEIKLCKKAHNWPSLETLKKLVKNEENCLTLPPKGTIQILRKHIFRIFGPLPLIKHVFSTESKQKLMNVIIH